MWSYIAGGVFLALAIYFIVQEMRCWWFQSIM